MKIVPRTLESPSQQQNINIIFTPAFSPPFSRPTPRFWSEMKTGVICDDDN